MSWRPERLSAGREEWRWRHDTADHTGAAYDDWRRLKQEVRDYAHQIGIDKIGFAAADPFLTLKERLYKHRELGYESGFEEKDIEKRAHPEQSLAEVKSIISIALAYPTAWKHRPNQNRASIGA